VTDDSTAVIAAAILAGGDSLRMGKDKAVLGDDGSSHIERQVSDLRDLSQSLPIYICSGSRRYEALNPYDVRHLPDLIHSAGPLGGVAKALDTAETAGLVKGYVLVLPTDSLIPPSHVYGRLTDTTPANAEVVLLRGEHLHPLHGLFSVALASCVKDYVESGGRSVMGFLDHRSWTAVNVPAVWEPCLNFNTPEEYERAQAAFAQATCV
tara:strand:+ start:590 stop:1216 length:627 start_codon:yes stop_codon:yes gene_type:complete